MTTTLERECIKRDIQPDSIGESTHKLFQRYSFKSGDAEHTIASHSSHDYEIYSVYTCDRRGYVKDRREFDCVDLAFDDLNERMTS